MRTAIIILVGFVLLGLCVLIGRLIGAGDTHSIVTAAKCSCRSGWPARCTTCDGIQSAGYSVAEELPVFLLIFALPAAAAVFLWWKFS